MAGKKMGALNGAVPRGKLKEHARIGASRKSDQHRRTRIRSRKLLEGKKSLGEGNIFFFHTYILCYG